MIDLSKQTVLPGFMDVHTHVLLQGDVTAAEYDEQLLKESIPYRAILAARNAQIALSHGFTAMRDSAICALDRKSTRLNSSHRCISYAVFCLKKKKQQQTR